MHDCNIISLFVLLLLRMSWSSGFPSLPSLAQVNLKGTLTSITEGLKAAELRLENSLRQEQHHEEEDEHKEDDEAVEEDANGWNIHTHSLQPGPTSDSVEHHHHQRHQQVHHQPWESVGENTSSSLLFEENSALKEQLTEALEVISSLRQQVHSLTHSHRLIHFKMLHKCCLD